jgi:hypothetical protein
MKAKIWALALATSALATTAANAQGIGVRAGVNFQNITGETAGDDIENKLKTGFHVGLNYEIPIAPEFYLQPGVLFSTKGAKADNDDETKTNLSYIEVPINFVFKPTLGTGKLVLGIGPYVAYAVGGKIKDDDDEVDIKFENDLTAAQAISNDPYLKPLDFGGNLLAGYEFSSKFSVQLNAQLGMSNLIPKIEGEKPEDTKWKNTGFGVSLGYRF